jgi:lipopolysaccharide biosynthesis glycosyltransferase
MGQGRVIDVVSVTDQRYAPLLAVVAASIARHLKSATRVRYHILYDGAGGELALRPPPACIELLRRPIAQPFGTLERGGHVSAATYLRLLVPETLSDVDRVVYLDLDLVVLTDIAILLDADIGGAALGGVLDFPLYGQLMTEARRSWRHHHLHRYLRRIGLDSRNLTYLNAGVAVMDLERLRRLDFSRRGTEMALRLNDKLRWLDQDVLNVVLRDELAILDPRWNSIVGTRNLDMNDPSQRPFIVHFASPEKPWRVGAHAGDAELWGEYARLAGVAATDIPPPPFVERPHKTVLERLLRR